MKVAIPAESARAARIQVGASPQLGWRCHGSPKASKPATNPATAPTTSTAMANPGLSHAGSNGSVISLPLVVSTAPGGMPTAPLSFSTEENLQLSRHDAGPVADPIQQDQPDPVLDVPGQFLTRHLSGPADGPPLCVAQVRSAGQCRPSKSRYHLLVL
jgi:hypothetical protein